MPLIVALAFSLVFQGPTYLDPAASPSRRASDLVGRMTLDEKISQMQHDAASIERLHIPAYNWWSEALHGSIGDRVTVFPQAIGLGATFDPELLFQVGTAISDEGRARYALASAKGSTGMHEGLTFWAPNINIFRDPRWGRGQETYGEDPYLTSRMAVAFVTSMQGEVNGKLKAVSTPKHFAVHSGPDPMRHQFNATPNKIDLWNFYLPAFKAAVTEGGAYSVMSAYSRLDDIPDSANKFLLQQTLRDKWGFKGYVVSDCGAISDIYSGHHYASSMAEAAADGVNAGCDLACGSEYSHLKEAYQQKLVTETAINKSVQRLMETRIRLGMFDPPATSGPWKTVPASEIDSPEHRQLALKAARESLVLLKNDGILPLKNFKKIAVIGPNANDRGVPLGNYNGQPSKLETVVDGLKALAPTGVSVGYAKGSDLTGISNLEPVPASHLPGGVHIDYFGNEKLEGAPIASGTSETIDFDWGTGPIAAGVPEQHISARMTTTLSVNATGDYQLGTSSDDGSRLKVDGKTVVDQWSIHPARNMSATVHLEAGKSYKLELEYFQAEGEASAKLIWSEPRPTAFGDALDLAKSSDVVVMVLGISGAIENEELDRQSIELPEIQRKLLAAVLATKKPVVVVLESGSCIQIDPKPLRGLLEAWYPGEEGGTAVAEALFGQLNPSGKLPVTFYKSLAQVPPIEDYKLSGRTYRYMTEEPLFPFGYGLSYTNFAYNQLRVSQPTPTELTATVEVANTGKRDGDDVIQIYAAREGAVWPEPLRRMIGFKRVHLAAGERQMVTIPVRFEAIALADENGKLAVKDGNYSFGVGYSMKQSRTIKLRLHTRTS